ncbi:polysaccharide deacetylase family protein [uncultured Mesonia sp.]|uniref:polysaccharide deacetylase family protein n=1 Tax=uncultured Mesonia sp. TaxID=399731 RepID=UPI00374EC57C
MIIDAAAQLGKLIFPKRLWHMPREEKSIYLSFDDGPIPEVTPWVLEQLTNYEAKASFFCIGENIKKHPEVFKKIISQGHRVGNHTYNHLNGWKTNNEIYIENTEKCENYIKSSSDQKLLFRPPYGKLRAKQAKRIAQNHQIVMWDILTLDYKPNICLDKRLDYIKENTRPGSILVFHDSLKAEKNLKKLLPNTLEYFSQAGYCFKSLP